MTVPLLQDMLKRDVRWLSRFPSDPTATQPINGGQKKDMLTPRIAKSGNTIASVGAVRSERVNRPIRLVAAIIKYRGGMKSVCGRSSRQPPM